jgi:hypothetical protein
VGMEKNDSFREIINVKSRITIHTGICIEIFCNEDQTFNEKRILR